MKEQKITDAKKQHLKQKLRRMGVYLLASALGMQSGITVQAAPQEVLDQIAAMKTLAELDINDNMKAIRIMLEQSLSLLDASDPIAGTLQSVLMLLEEGQADSASVCVLLQSAIDQGASEDSQTCVTADLQEDSLGETELPETKMGETELPETEMGVTEAVSQETEEQMVPQKNGDTGSEEETREISVRESTLGIPVYETDFFLPAIMQEQVLVDVPGSWGNNESGRSLTSYSPVNGSGAISPAAGTLSISYFPMEGRDAEESFDIYEENIGSMSVTTGLESMGVTAADLPARKIAFTMSVGANQFTCETVCFAHEGSIYAIELLQGQQTQFDYFPMYDIVVGSAEVGTEERIAQARAEKEAAENGEIEMTESGEPTELPETEEAPEPETFPEEPETQSVTEMPETEGSSAFQGNVSDMGTFQYALNDRVYQFPTPVQELDASVLQLDRQLTLPYEFTSDADMEGGKWTEIVNTQYYYFQNALYKEMAGVTNMSGHPVPMTEGILTALIDTQGTYIDICLPGGVTVGSQESDILRGFPEFEQIPMDGTAFFRGNELLYARNVRDDGCNGYALIRNDAPYYSALTIICESGVIREISFECLGSVRANGIFL